MNKLHNRLASKADKTECEQTRHKEGRRHGKSGGNERETDREELNLTLMERKVP